MIKLVDIIKESILKTSFKGKNILYHSTYIDKILNIISNNEIEPKTTQKILTKFTSDDSSYNGVSLTRNANLKFGDIQLMLDGDLIKRDFGKKLIPYDHFSQFGSKVKSNNTRSDYNESEEFLIGALNPISKYLLGIRFMFSKEEIEEFKTEEPEIFSLLKQKTENISIYDINFNEVK